MWPCLRDLAERYCLGLVPRFVLAGPIIEGAVFSVSAMPIYRPILPFILVLRSRQKSLFQAERKRPAPNTFPTSPSEVLNVVSGRLPVVTNDPAENPCWSPKAHRRGFALPGLEELATSFK